MRAVTMRINNAFTLDRLADYLAIPDSQRPIARYQKHLLDPVPAFTPEECGRFVEIVAANDHRPSRFDINRLLIDLSWASSRLEGNTYTQLDTQALIEYGERHAGKPVEDAAMILNHKRAIEYMLSNAGNHDQNHGYLTRENIQAIHARLADDRLAPGSRHFLDQSRCGAVRSYTEEGIYIAGSSYIPPQAEDRETGFIEHEFDRLIASANALPGAVNQSFFLMTRIPYLQVFYDANKRTSRISCNIPLIASGLSPLSFIDIEKRRYLEGLIAFYELGDERLAKAVFIDAYLASAFRYLPFREGARVALSVEKRHHIADARRYILEGVREGAPVWLRTHDPDLPENPENRDADSDAPPRSNPRP